MTVAIFRKKKWNPRRLGTSLAAWYKADAGCYTDAACLFASASSQYLSKASPTFSVTNKMTIRFSIKPTDVTGFQGILGRWGSGDDQFTLTANGGVLQFYTAEAAVSGGGNHQDTGIVLASGVPADVVVVYDGTQAASDRVKFYIDGSLVASSTSGTIATSLRASSSPLHVGTLSVALFLDASLARLGFSSLALSGAALTAAHASTFWANMTAARQADWFSFYNLCEASSTRVDSTGLNNLTPTNGPTVAAGPGEGLAVNNSPVKRWEDQSGNARHLLQATIANQPLYLTGIQNGKPVVRFDGTDDYFTNGDSINLTTMFSSVVAKISVVNTNVGLWSKGTNDIAFVPWNASAAGYHLAKSGVEAIVQKGSDSITQAWCNYEGMLAAGTGTLWEDGAQVATAGYAGSLTNGATLEVGREGAGAPLTGDMGELVFCGAALTAVERQSNEGYQRSKWSLP